MARRLRFLVAQGVLPEGSTFTELRGYLNDEVVHTSGAMEEVEETAPAKAPEIPVAAKRIDLTATPKFVNAENGNEVATTKVQRRPFLPRKLATPQKPETKAPLTTPTPAHVQTAEQDALIQDFYNQVKLATEYRKRSEQPPAITTPLTPKTASLTVRAFECEPELCGLVDVGEEKEHDAIEIDPPSLPFVDSYRRRNKKTKSQKKEEAVVDEEGCDGLTGAEILELERVGEAVVGTEIYFKSMFLHPVQMVPVILWRRGTIVSVKGAQVDVQVHGGPADEDQEEGEVNEETFTWSQFMDVRLRA
jgi:hypothetical protein